MEKKAFYGTRIRRKNEHIPGSGIGSGIWISLFFDVAREFLATTRNDFFLLIRKVKVIFNQRNKVCSLYCVLFYVIQEMIYDLACGIELQYGCTWEVGRYAFLVFSHLPAWSPTFPRDLPPSRVISHLLAWSPIFPRALPPSCVISHLPTCIQNLMEHARPWIIS